MPKLNALFAEPEPEREAHGGLVRPSCSRVISEYPKGTEIRNTQQFTLHCANEIAEIAKEMWFKALDPA